jgi:hypothetical protein
MISKKAKKELKREIKEEVKAELPKVRNRRPRRQRKTARPTVVTGTNEIVTAKGYDFLVQSLFSGVRGIHRGITWGNQRTALARFKAVADISIPLNTFLTYIWSPSFVSTANIFVYSSGTGATSVQDPYNSLGTANVTSTTMAGPFNGTSPALAWRIVRAAMKITNTTAITSQAGFQLHSYSSTAYQGSPASGTMSAIPAGAGWTTTNLENINPSMTFSGQTSTMLQFYPNDSEIYVQDANFYSSNESELSGFLGTIFAGSVAQSYHIEFDYGIEYVPTLAYRPYVDTALPAVAPQANYYLTHFIDKNWNHTVITTWQDYVNHTSSIEHLPSARSWSYMMASTVGIPRRLPRIEAYTMNPSEYQPPDLGGPSFRGMTLVQGEDGVLRDVTRGGAVETTARDVFREAAETAETRSPGIRFNLGPRIRGNY